MERTKSCCMSGHRNEKLTGFTELTGLELCKAINKAIYDGYTTFYHGCCNGIDLIAAKHVLMQRQTNNAIRLISVIPHEGQANKWTEYWRDKYFDLLEKSDEVIMLHTKYVNGCHQERNRYMVDRSSRLIAVYDGVSSGGTKNTIQYARTQNIDIHIIQT